MNNDIVKRLQAIECSDAFSRNLLNKACEEIERLRQERDEARREMCGMGALCAEAADEIERLRGMVNGTANTQGDKVAKEMHQNDGD